MNTASNNIGNTPLRLSRVTTPRSKTHSVSPGTHLPERTDTADHHLQRLQTELASIHHLTEYLETTRDKLSIIMDLIHDQHQSIHNPEATKRETLGSLIDWLQHQILPIAIKHGRTLNIHIDPWLNMLPAGSFYAALVEDLWKVIVYADCSGRIDLSIRQEHDAITICLESQQPVLLTSMLPIDETQYHEPENLILPDLRGLWIKLARSLRSSVVLRFDHSGDVTPSNMYSAISSIEVHHILRKSQRLAS